MGNKHLVANPGVIVRADLGRDVFNQAAAESDVENLDSPTYGQDRHLATERFARQGRLESIAAGIDFIHLLGELAPIEGGVDVAATGEQQAVEPVEQVRHGIIGHWGEQHRDSAGTGGAIAVGVVERIRPHVAA